MTGNYRVFVGSLLITNQREGFKTLTDHIQHIYFHFHISVTVCSISAADTLEINVTIVKKLKDLMELCGKARPPTAFTVCVYIFTK